MYYLQDGVKIKYKYKYKWWSMQPTVIVKSTTNVLSIGWSKTKIQIQIQMVEYVANGNSKKHN